jgi:hypothetical protein
MQAYSDYHDPQLPRSCFMTGEIDERHLVRADLPEGCGRRAGGGHDDRPHLIGCDDTGSENPSPNRPMPGGRGLVGLAGLKK